LVPGEKLSGQIGLPAFPSWFGKNSKQGRVDRILQELQKHMRIHISANKIGVGMEYLSVFKGLLAKPLIKKGADGIPQVINVMNEYSLTRDDFDTILELATWPGQKDLASQIDSKVKASFTRTYNKESHKNPFTIVNVKKLKPLKQGDEMIDGEEEEDDEEEANDDDINKDAMIKINANKGKASKGAAAAKTSTAVKRTAKQSEEIDGGGEKPKAKKKKT
jgi:replication factor C subunit 1